ncbi:hypothetical protein [Actinopolymorpha rutila]|uniref:Uncharacterized protein n=1 Tax=Actinopolymorpha rutila TaxID=446787 RepID=A0A852ZII0_9ACTN|nr:hypothetical protein [Actinopolymorpha rutila]NYH92921.1 hypothetical protein [Actinopolymorpha rutila]
MAPIPATTNHAPKASSRRALAILVAVALLAAGAWWWLLGQHQATPWVVEGQALTNSEVTAISLHKASVKKFNNEGFVIGGATWSSKGGPWHDAGGTSCLKSRPNSFQHVRLGIIENRGDPEGAGSRWAVVWIECLD